MTARDVFISHSSGDAEQARALRALVEGAGYSVWMAPDDIVGTETWTEQILNAIADSRAMIVLVSTAANRSQHVSREVNLATGRGRAVLPIRIEDVDPTGSLEYLLALVQRVDAFPPPVEQHRDRILRRLASIIKPSGEMPIAAAPQTDTQAVDAAGDSPTTPDSGAARPPGAAGPGDAQAPGPIGPGTVIGDFTVESMLGEGGMASVYRARQDEPRRLVALKVIRADHAANEKYRKRFLGEKETLAQLEHPSIVPIYAAGESRGVLYIAMRLVDGPDLQARITRQGRLSLRETVQILKPIADAVDYAHAIGVVHRDLKPSNIILDRDSRPYLTDFGLGKRLEVETNLSVPGIAIGTLDYMAPEQFTGTSDPALGPRIDVYALGCVAYTCLTGRPPFERPTPEQLMYAHAHEPVPAIRSVLPEYPPQIDEVFGRVLAKDPSVRFESARAFLSALEAVVLSSAAGQTSQVVVTADSTPVGQARRWVSSNSALAVGGGVAAIVVAVVLLAGLVFRPPGPSPLPTVGGAGSVGPAVTSAPATSPPVTEPPVTAPPVTAPPVTALPESRVTPNPDGGFPTAAEARLLTALPATDVDIDSCRATTAAGYESALAFVACGPPAGFETTTFFALYADVESLSAQYAGVMSGSTVPQPTASGCFETVPSNNNWNFGGVAGPREGQLGCYPRTDTVNGEPFNGVQHVWTFERSLVLGLWLAPDHDAGIAYFSKWATDASADAATR